MMDFKNESSLNLQYSLSDQLNSCKTYAQPTFFFGNVPQNDVFFLSLQESLQMVKSWKVETKYSWISFVIDMLLSFLPLTQPRPEFFFGIFHGVKGIFLRKKSIQPKTWAVGSRDPDWDKGSRLGQGIKIGTIYKRISHILHSFLLK